MQNLNGTVVPLGRVPQDNALNGHPRRRKTGQGARLNQSNGATWKKPTLKDFLGVTPKELVEGDAQEDAPAPVKLLKSLFSGSLWSSDKTPENGTEEPSSRIQPSAGDEQEQQIVLPVNDGCDAPRAFMLPPANNAVEPQTNFEKYLQMKQLGGGGGGLAGDQQWQQPGAPNGIHDQQTYYNAQAQPGTGNFDSSTNFAYPHCQSSSGQFMHADSFYGANHQYGATSNANVLSGSAFNSFANGNAASLNNSFQHSPPSLNYASQDVNSNQWSQLRMTEGGTLTTPQSPCQEWNPQTCVGGNGLPDGFSSDEQHFQAVQSLGFCEGQSDNEPNWFSQKSYLPQIPDFAHMTAPVSGAPFHPGFSYATEFKYYYNYYPAEEYVGEIDGKDPKAQEEAVARAQSKGIDLEAEGDDAEAISQKPGLKPLVTSTKRLESGKAIPLPLQH